MDVQFWKEKRVLITGHTGFKGSWLSLWLQHMGAEVTGYALSAPTNPSLFELANMKELMHSEEADIRNFNRLESVITNVKPEIVFHLAAQSLVRFSYIDPLQTYTTNVIGTVNLLEAIRKTSSVRVVVNITSDKCYENKEWVWGYRENEPMGGYDPYSSSKGCSELITMAYRNSYFSKNEHFDSENHTVALASARAGNVIGGGDWSEDRLIPDIIKAFLQKRAAIIRNPDAVRPWQHVLEPLCGYMCLAEGMWRRPDKYNSGWNFGPHYEDAKPVRWIVENLIKKWGGDASWVPDPGSHPHEAHTLRLDCSKAVANLGWKPVMGIEESLAWVTQWYQDFHDGNDMRNKTLEQIKLYQDRVMRK